MLNTLFSQSECRDAFWELTQAASNYALYSALSEAMYLGEISHEARCLLAPGYRLVRVDRRLNITRDVFEIALLNDVDCSVVYYSKIAVTSVSEANLRPAIQNLVWRSPDARYAAVMRDVALNVIFNYVIERYDIILSDSQERGVGRYFWQALVSRAISYGLCAVYVATPEDHQPISTQETLNDLVGKLWTEVNEQRDHLMLISKPAHSHTI